MPERIVIALGGNALQRKGEATADAQERVARETASRLASLIVAGHQLVIVHGNGPQVGNIVLHEEAMNTSEVPTLPLDTCVAMSQGSIGYWLQQAMINEFTVRGMKSTATTAITQMVVDANDPAFQNPTKPIGPFYGTESEARTAAEARQFTVKEDSGRGWRRVVASPKPIRIVEEYTVRQMIDAGVTVITGGGGGVPVVENADGTFRGVEAVIDKDFAAAKIAEAVGATRLVILTAVQAVMTGYGTPDQRELSKLSTTEAEQLIAEGQFAAGSMLPKVQAALAFVTKTGQPASIGGLDDVDGVIAGTSGTVIVAK